ncbi:MAG: hypothetical protein ACQEP2_00720 [Actinomycetota bacterium]
MTQYMGILFLKKRMKYFLGKPKVTYKYKYEEKIAGFKPFQWRQLASHIPGKGKQAVCYCRYYNNVKRGRLKKRRMWPEYHIIEDDSPGGLNKFWAYTEDV